MFHKPKSAICFTLIFVLTLFQMQVLSSTNVYAQTEESPFTKEVIMDDLDKNLEGTDEPPLKTDSITFDKSNIEPIGTTFRFTTISQNENVNYEWTLFKDFHEVYKKQYSEENFLDFTINESGKYQTVVRIRHENGMTISKLSEEITIIPPIKIHSVWVDKDNKQPINTPLNFSVSAEGDHLMYRWSIFKDSNIVHDGTLSEKNSICYTPKEPGIYKGVVYIHDRFKKSISASSEKIQIYKHVVSEEEKIEILINEKDFHSKTNNYIWLDTKKNIVYVFEGENKNWTLTKTMVCTDGKPSTPTVKGHFTINGRAPWLTSYSGRAKAKYKVRFFGNYYFHSIVFDSKGRKVIDSRLGKSLSAGCVRLSVDNAKWVYDHIKDGTGVYIY